MVLTFNERMMKYWPIFVLLVVALVDIVSAITHGSGYYDPKIMVKVNKLGKVRGKKEIPTYVKRPFYSYLGIPYAEEPRYHLRFKDPRVYPGWEGRLGFDGVLDATEQPPPCLQLNLVKLDRGKVEAVGEENCLNLNVFTSQPNNRTGKLPVMVYIHGGGYWFGSSRDAHPHVLLNKDIVLVSIQYRLGVLGFMTTEDDVMPGNLGLKDQAMALAWVKKHIKVFGGDPDNITLFGNSAGGGSVSMHVLSPKSTGLFHRAILQSGSAVCPWSLGAEDQLSLAKRVAATVDCPTEEGSEAMHKCFRTANATKIMMTILDTFEYGRNPLVFGPRVDGEFLPERPEVLLKNGKFNKLPIMTGTTRDEGAISTLGTLATDDGLKKYFEEFDASAAASLHIKYKGDDDIELAKHIFKHYFGDNQPTIDDHQKLTEIYTSCMFSVCQDVTALLLSHHLAPQHSVYSYVLTHRGKQSLADLEAKGKKPAKTLAKDYVCHADELLYLFGSKVFGFGANRDKVDIEMQKLVSSLWINFATNSAPTPDDSLGFQWLPVTVEEFRHLDIKPQPAMQQDNRQKVREFWLSLPTQQNRLLEDVDFLQIKIEEGIKEQHNDPSETTTQEQDIINDEADSAENKDEFISEDRDAMAKDEL